MKTIEQIIKENRIFNLTCGEDGGHCYIKLIPEKKIFTVIFSWGCNWEHVSVSLSNRCPTWDEMCIIKNIFWNDNETVIQFHPSKENYKNLHPYCLHLWKPIKEKLPIPYLCLV